MNCWAKKLELTKKYKKNKIVADALAAHIVSMLSENEYDNMDIEDICLSSESLCEIVTEIQSISEQMDKVKADLGK